MKLKVNKFQQGGPMGAEDPAMAEQGAPMGAEAPAAGGDPEQMLMQLAQLAAQALQNQDCEAAMAVCQGFLELAQGGGQPEQTEPVYRKGGKLLRRLS